MKPVVAFAVALVVGAVAVLSLLLSAPVVGQGRAVRPQATVEALPPGAVVQTVQTGMDKPVAMAFDPAGRLFYVEKQTGSSNEAGVRLIANNVLQASPVITFAVDTCSERGLLGIAIDPQFTSTHYVYVYYTAYTNGCGTTENRVARFVENNGVGSNPQTLFTSPQTAGNHDGGNIHFGPDGKLYITIGENANPANSQDVTVKNGKIHRINPDGTIPADNPVFTQTGALPSLFAMGLRNSYDFTFDSLSPFIFASENGPGCDDEMNRIVGGYNYGWRSGYPCDDANPSPAYNTIAPMWYVPNGQCCIAPTGIEVYRGASVPQWQNNLFMCSFNDGALHHFYLDGTRTSVLRSPDVSGITCNTDIATGNDGAFYYIEGGGYSAGTLKRITCPVEFSDMPNSDPFYPYIHCLACQGILSGYGDGTFRPNATITRGQMSKLVVNAVSIGDTIPSGQQTFSDVPASHPFWLYIERLAGRGYVNGYGDGTFHPSAPVTRGQLAKVTSNTAGYADTPAGQTFADVPPGSPFYVYVERVNTHGVISGYGCNAASTNPCTGLVESCPGVYFRPCATATRGQTAKIVGNTFYPNCQAGR